MQEMPETFNSWGWEDPLEEKMATHSSVLAWKIPWTEEPGGLQSMGSKSWTRLSDGRTLGDKGHQIIQDVARMLARGKRPCV